MAAYAEEVEVRIKLDRLIAPAQIWDMPELRLVSFRSGGGSYLPEPPTSNNVVVMRHLHTLRGVKNFKLSEEVVTRIPNIRKLDMWYDETAQLIPSDYYCLNNVQRLQNLISLNCRIHDGGILGSLIFPPSLQKLSLEAEMMQWNNLLMVIGSLPLLEKLELYFGSFQEDEWRTEEGRFPSLKFLRLFGRQSLKHWTTRSSHFPCLEELVLGNLDLNEIPPDIGEIATLKSISLANCSESAVRSAKVIAEAAAGKTPLQVQVTIWERNEDLESLASANFHVQVI